MDFEELHEKYERIIRGKGAPVGVKLLTSKDELKESGVRPLENNRALCQVLKLSSVYEKTRGVFFDNVDACVVGTYIMGFGMPPKDLKERWIQGFAYDPETFDKMVENIEALPQKKYEAAVFAPLKEFQKMQQEPDSIIMMVNSSQSYLLLVGHFDSSGKKTSSTINGHAACEVISAVAIGKSPWITIPCGGARSIADSQDDEIWVGMTAEELDKTLKRLEQIGFKYPPAVNQMTMSDMNPQHPLTYLIAREGPGKQ